MPFFTSNFLRSIALVAFISTFISIVNAAACTSAQIADLSTLSNNVTAVCGNDALSSTTTAYCSDSSCLAYLTSMASNVPSCEVESYNLRTVLTTAINSCDAASDAVPASKSNAHLPHLQQWTALVPLVVMSFML